MSVYEAVKEAISVLNEIQIPVREMNSIGAPIAYALERLNGCVDAWDRAAKEAAEKQKAEEGQENVVEMPRNEAAAEEVNDHE